MSGSALLMMITSQVIIVGLTLYFYKKVMKAPKKREPDTYSENDDE